MTENFVSDGREGKLLRRQFIHCRKLSSILEARDCHTYSPCH